MERVQIGHWIIEVDLEATRDYYRKQETFSERCTCMNCKNFVAATEQFPQPVLHLFHSLGIDPTKDTGEIMEFAGNEDGTRLYMGWYHIKGNIVEGPDCDPFSGGWNEENSLDIDAFSFGFSERNLQMLADDFPLPAMAVHFSANIPWVLSEQPDDNNQNG